MRAEMRPARLELMPLNPIAMAHNAPHVSAAFCRQIFKKVVHNFCG
jgi:hypothetical protein